MIKMVTQWFGLDTMAREEFEAMRPDAEIAVMKVTLYYEGKVKQKLRGPRTGRMYGTHQASAPGEPPAALSGDLRKTITHSEVKWDGDEVFAEVGSPMAYARILEFGGIIRGVSSNGKSYIIRILPRPYFSATWIEEEEKMQDMLDKAMRKAPFMGDIVVEVVE